MRSLKSIGQKSLGVVSSLAIAAGASAQDAVQWRVEDGGNGHWYLVSTTPRTFANARDWTHSHGATLALIDSASENEFLFHLTLNTTGPWVGKGPFFGLFQDTSSPDFSEPSGGWRWVDSKGVTERFSAFCGGQPDNAHTGQQLGVYWAPGGNPGSCWDDDVSVEELDIVAGPHLIEWSADCNSDGIVDYGQIRAGELEDANSNNIPDCCEQSTSCESCAADIDGSGTVNAVDLAAILTVWGTDGGKYPRADINGDGEVNGPDLAAVLSNWGSCP